MRDTRLHSLPASSLQSASFGATRRINPEVIETAYSVGASPVMNYRLRNHAGLCIEISSFGARICQLFAPDRNGRAECITYGASDLGALIGEGCDPFHCGATIGRVANRTAAEFVLDGQTHRIVANSKGVCLHGGAEGFDRRNWNSRIVDHPLGPCVEFSLRSPDGDQGFPGNLDVKVRYILLHNRLRIEYVTSTDKPTHVNLTNHTYWRLCGPGTSDILDHEMTISARFWTQVDEALMPNGKFSPLQGTALDFKRTKQIRDAVLAFADKEAFKGIDHNFVVDLRDPEQSRRHSGFRDPAHVVSVHDPVSGRWLHVHSSMPGVQIYSDNFGSPTHMSLAIEPQYFPNSANIPDFPSTVLRPPWSREDCIEFQFSADQP